MDVDGAASAGAQEEKSNDKVVEVRNPSFEVERYANEYTGRTKLERLLFIARRCPDVKDRALRMAVDNAKSVKDTRLYGQIMDAAGGLADGKNDIPWMQRTEAVNIQKTKELDDLVIKWRNLSKREQTRSAYMDAAKHYSSKGEYGAALSKFIEAKDYISQVEHQLEANLQITIASIRLGS